jgi:hypothetical protein
MTSIKAVFIISILWFALTPLQLSAAQSPDIEKICPNPTNGTPRMRLL